MQKEDVGSSGYRIAQYMPVSSEIMKPVPFLFIIFDL